MLNFSGQPIACCDGSTRRSFLKVGALSLGGLSLPQVLAARSANAAAGKEVRGTSVIFVEQAGGPTHMETYDPKPDSPSEYRGPLGTVRTNVPGVFFSQLMSEQAKIMDRLAVVRSMHHDNSSHGTSAHLTQTGYYLRNRQNRDNEMPCIGAMTAQVRGANATGIPAYVSVPREMRFGKAAYLGKGHNPFVTGGDPNSAGFAVDNLSLNQDFKVARLDDRRTLLKQLDARRRVVDSTGVSESIDQFTQQAFDLVTGDRARRAFDIAAESDAMRDRYGRNTTGQSMLLARRLVEEGVTFVTVRTGSWDDHNGIEQRMKSKGPSFDQGLAALVTDLHERGIDRDVMVVAMGEFGRTPRVNKNAGRDHWGGAMSVLLAGGGLKVGQVVGSSNPRGEEPQDKPYRPENVLALLYRHLGIDTGATFLDLSGRPRYVLETRELITELV